MKLVLAITLMEPWLILDYCVYSTIGLLLSVVLNVERKHSPFLLLVDAKTMEETGRVEFEGVQMHKDFHGVFQNF